MRFRHSLLLLGAAAAIACSDTPLFPRPAMSIRVVDGGGGSDTVLAPAADLVIQVRDKFGLPSAGASVFFHALPPASDSTSPLRGMYVCPMTELPCAIVYDENNFSVWFGAGAVTDSNGIARAHVQFGVVAGRGAIEIIADSTGRVRKTVFFAVQPGSRAKVVTRVADTAVYVGAGYDMGARAADRFGNPRVEPVAVTVLTPALVQVSGDHLTATGLGRGSVQVQSGPVADTAYVSVVPPGRLAAYFNGHIKLLNTDGSTQKNVLATYGDNGSPLPSWTTGGRIVFEEMGDFYTYLHVTDTLGNRQLLLSNPGGFQWSMHPQTSPSGSVYFYGPGGVYRANPDGTGSQFIVAGVAPFPSGDESKLGYYYGDSVYVRDMATSQKTPLGSNIGGAVWSPVDDQVAFVGEGASGVYVMDGDGGNRHLVASGFFTGRIAWSPDGQWIAASKIGGDFFAMVGLELIRVSTGEQLPIPGTSGYVEPAWRP